jgi:transcriptional regulator with XRE-family HTH domain
MSDLLDQLNDLISEEGEQAAYKHELAMSAFTNEIARRMHQLGISQSELARRLDVSRARVSQLMQHKTSPTLRTMVDVALALDCEVTPVLAPRGLRPARFLVADGGRGVAGYRARRPLDRGLREEDLPSELLAV